MGEKGLGICLSLFFVRSFLRLSIFRLACAYWPGHENDVVVPRRVSSSSAQVSYDARHCSFARDQNRNKHFEKLYLTGKIGLELVPQGTLVERLRAHAAGIPAFYTPTGSSTAVEQGAIPVRYNDGGPEFGIMEPGHAKEVREFNGKRYVMEPALAGDVAFVRAWKADEAGNVIFRFVEDPLMS